MADSAEAAFRAFERDAHDHLAGSYHDFFAKLTARAAEPLLDAAHLAPGMRALDVACGSGVLSAALAKRGANAVGVDLAAAMLEIARRANPTVAFLQADVERIPFADAAFDAVICGFGLGHFPNAERAAAECARVLGKGRWLAFAWWDLPARQRVQGVFVDALNELGIEPPSGIPQGPPMTRYSDDVALAGLLHGAGLADIRVTTHDHTVSVPSPAALWVSALGGMARTGSVIRAQSKEIQARIRALVERNMERYRSGEGYTIPFAFKVAAGRKG